LSIPKSSSKLTSFPDPPLDGFNENVASTRGKNPPRNSVYFDPKSDFAELFSSPSAALALETIPTHSTRNAASNPVGHLRLILY